jgi:DNA-directed RNA polymerase subunit delta
MLAIQGLKCIYDTGARGWAVEVTLDGEGENAARRFDVDGPDDAEMLIEAFEDSSFSTFDPATGEIVFTYEYADLDGDEDEDEEDDADESDEDEDEDEDVSEDETSSDEDEKAKA